MSHRKHAYMLTVPLAVAVLLVLTSAASAVGVKWLSGQIGRQPWEVALDRAKRTNEPIMAFCYEENRQLTVMMEAQTFGTPEVEDAAEGFLCVRLDALALESQPFLDMYEVGRKSQMAEGRDGPVEIRHQTFPVTLFLAPDGRLAHIVYGYVIPADFIVIMERATEVIELLGRLDDEATEVPALMRLGALYVELQRYPAGREVLSRAIELDADGTHGAAEQGLLDLALTHMAAGQPTEATELVKLHVDNYGTSELRCKAQYLLGGTRLAAAQLAEQLAEEMDEEGNADAAKIARDQVATNRKEAIEAWAWFEGDHLACPPSTEGEDWQLFSLSALYELRARDAYAPVEARVEALLAEKDYQTAVATLRAFVEIEEYKGTEASCSSEYLIGECLLRAGKPAEAKKQWQSLKNRKPSENAEKLGDPCGNSQWPTLALQALAGLQQE